VRTRIRDGANDDLLAAIQRRQNSVGCFNDDVFIGLVVWRCNIDQEQCDASIAFAITSIIARLSNCGVDKEKT
jgi:hypothetical protein